MRPPRPLALFLLALAVAAPGAAAAPSVAPAATAAPKDDEALSHTLKAGETLYSVARKYGVSVDAIASVNGIADASKLKPGQKLLIPSVHKVKKGETLFSIARSCGADVGELRRLNKLSDSAVLQVGQVLLLPQRSKDGGALPSVGAPPAAAAPAPVPASPAPAAPAQGAGGLPLAPDPVRTSLKAVDKKVSWPCSGEALYLDGKAQGVMIRAKLGEAEKAVASGKVVAAGPFRGYGQMAIVMSRTGHLYVYAGNDSLSVKVGDAIRPGQEIGKVGMDAKAGQPVAFFMVYHGRESVDAAEAPRE
jgi:LysM repeat protein